MVVGLVENMLTQDYSRLDSFAQAHLVREEVALQGIVKNASHHLDLIGFQRNGRGEKCYHASGNGTLLNKMCDEAGPRLMEEGCFRQSG